MTDLETWFESSSNLLNNQIKRVDVSGCEIGEIDRPAKTYYGRDEVELKTPSAPNGWVRTEDSVDLEAHR